MRREFSSYYEALEWMIQNAKSESHFVVLYEDLTINHSVTGEYFVYNFIAEPFAISEF